MGLIYRGARLKTPGRKGLIESTRKFESHRVGQDLLSQHGYQKNLLQAESWSRHKYAQLL